jgi:hypothetical protein
MTPKVSLILVNWNGFDLTKNCIESIYKITYPNYEIVLVDNGSVNDVERLKQLFPAVTYIENGQNLGFVGGNNVGIRYALKTDAKYIMLLNNDTIVEPDFLTKLVDTLNSDETIGALTPKIYFLHRRDKIWALGGSINLWLGIFKNRSEGKIDHGQFNQVEEVDFVTGCCFMVRRTVIEQIGLLPKDYFIYYEDSDWSLRIKRLGYRMLCIPGSVIYHVAGASNTNKKKGKDGKSNPIVWYLHVRNQIWMYRKYASWFQYPTLFVVTAAKMLFYLAAFTGLRRWGKVKAVLRGIGHGFTITPDYTD